MSGGFFRGTTADQDTRFSNKHAKLLKSHKFPPELENLVDMTKVKMDVMRPWIAHRVTELLGFEDEVLINFIYGLLEEKVVNGKEIQISLTGFMEKNTGKFMKELWTHLLSAQQNTSGVPQQFLDAKEEETKKKQEDTARITRELKRIKEKEEQERVKMDREADDVKAANLEAHPRRRTKFSSKWSADDKGTDERNGSKETARIPRSPHSADHSPSPPRGTRPRSVSNSFSNSRSHSSSRSLSASPKPLRHSASHERRSHSLSRRSSTPRRVGSRQRSPFLAPSRRQSPSPARRRLRSPSPASSRGRSPSPARRRLQSPTYRRSRSPVRQRSRSPLRRRSRSPVRRRSRTPIRRSRTPIRRRSRTPIRRRSRTPIRRRSRTPIRRKSRTPIRRKSRSPIRRRSRTPIRRRSRTPIRRRSRTPIRRRSRTPIRRSPTPIQRRSRSPIRRRSSSPFQRRPRSPYLQRSQSTTSSSPVHSRSPSPVRRRSPSPMRGQYQKASRSPPPIRRQRSPRPGNRSSSPSGRSSVSPTRGTPPPLPKRGSPKREQRSSLWSSRDGHRDHQAPRRVPAESHSPVPVRSFKREPKGDEISHHGEPTLSPSLHKSRSSPSGESPLPPKRQRKGVITKDHLENVEVEGMTFSSKNDGRTSDPELSSDRVQDSEKGYKADETNQEAVNMPKDQSGSLDSASEESDHKRKHKRKDVTSGDDNSHDSHAEDRKEAKRRRKEEKKLKKQEKRIRREERRRKKDIRRSEKLKLKAHGNVSPSSDFDKSRDESVALSDEKKLEIELREKALESLRAKKGVAR
ncbi:putative PWI domain-containing protein [Helianthus annuus]|nr:putative PWI domain-containing protein [Helianthus annuus]KAJ0926514.1 putative PWI domain-containing protein [Helianthus annuus]KAJ0930984.1 putative PWI domain-containing protein [Helianthus annuus]